MRLILVAIGAVAVLTALVLFILYRDTMAGGVKTPTQKVDGRLWDFSVQTLEGAHAQLADYQGQVALVVNVASKCGLTPQYKDLESLYRARKDQGFVVLAFPSNDFMGQEPGTAEEIRFFCSENYDVTFPMFEKVKVKGAEKSEVYGFLTAGGLEDPTWNFTKYLVGKDGRVIARYAPKTTPDDADLAAAIDKALAGPSQ
jgi:glutathione peroxidase